MKVILVRLAGTELDEDLAVLESAYRVATRFGSHIIALHARWTSPDFPLLAQHTPDSVSRAAADAFFRWQTANNILLAKTPVEDGHVPTAEFAEESGDQIDRLLARAALSDLVVLARPKPGGGVFSFMALEAALFESARPVLVVPALRPKDVFVNPVFAWNGSQQATRALLGALPILRECAGTVAVLTVPESNCQASAVDAISYLAWHGIGGELAKVGTGTAGGQLLAIARARGAGLVTCGAFTRSRWRQALFGGVTSHLITHSDVPLLMAN